MTTSELVRALLTAVEAQRWDEARGYLTDDFTFGDGAMPEPLGRDAWLTVHKAFVAAMPDFSFNARPFHDENGAAVGQVQLTGTQTRELKLPVPGIPAIPPTGKRLSLPAETITATTRGDQISAFIVSGVEGGGLQGVLSQLGASIPTHG